MRGAVTLLVSTCSLAAIGAVCLRPAMALPRISIDASEARIAMEKASEQADRARRRAAEFDARSLSATQAGDRAALAVAAMAARVQQSEAGLAAAEARLTMVTGQRRKLDLRLAQEREPIVKLMAGLQSMVRRPPIMSLVQPGSLRDTVHLRAILSTVGPQIRAKTEGLRGEIAESRKLEQAAGRAAAEQKTRSKTLLARRKELETVAAEQRLAAQRAAGSADRETERAFAMAEQSRSLGALVHRFESAAPQVQRRLAGETQGRPFTAPVQGPVLPPASRSVTSIGYLARPGSLVLAPADGRVAFAGSYRGYGEVVILEHADSWTSLLTGMAEVNVIAGQRVIAGFPLGRTGNRNDEITFELRRAGIVVSASQYVR